MIVQCPNCKTNYNVSDDLLKRVSPAFRCSRCKHTFQIKFPEPPHERVDPPLPVAPQPAESNEPSFNFPPREQAQTPATEGPPVDIQRSESKSPTAEIERSAPWAISAAELKPDEPFTIFEDSAPAAKKAEPEFFDPSSEHRDLRPGVEPLPTAGEVAENILRLGRYRDQQASTAPYLSLFGLLIIFFLLATAFNQAHPTATAGFVRQIPLVGTSVLRNNRLKDGVLLQSLRAGYQSIQGNREVFVVTGTALNQNPVSIRAVQISAQTISDGGGEIENQTVWVGNAISPTIVRGLSLEEIANLQRLPPLKSFEIPPGDSVPFTIVFVKTPKGAKDFGCKVIAAEGDA
jgi:predicted Zn finger-like uncharacterized protein